MSMADTVEDIARSVIKTKEDPRYRSDRKGPGTCKVRVKVNISSLGLAKGDVANLKCSVAADLERKGLAQIIKAKKG